MRRIQLTSVNYTGIIELLYDLDEIIVTIDFTNTNMSHAQRQTILKVIPAHFQHLGEAFSKFPQITAVEKDFEISFDTFWIRYDHKINKARCIPLWDKLKKADQVAAFYGIRNYEKFLKKTEWRKKADPETYLRNRSWENEY